MAVSSQCPFRTPKSTGNSLVPGAQKSWESDQSRAMSQSCPGDSLRCILVVSTSDYSNLLFPLLLCRRSGSGRSLWQPCRGSLLARACVSPEVSRGGFPGCALASLLCFPSNRGKGSRNPGCSLRGPGWVRAGAVLPREPPVRAQQASIPGEPLRGRHIRICSRSMAENKPCCRFSSLGTIQTNWVLSRDAVCACLQLAVLSPPLRRQEVCSGSSSSSRAASRAPGTFSPLHRLLEECRGVREEGISCFSALEFCLGSWLLGKRLSPWQKSCQKAGSLPPCAFCRAMPRGGGALLQPAYQRQGAEGAWGLSSLGNLLRRGWKMK